jgi:hypothetical protein
VVPASDKAAHDALHRTARRSRLLGPDRRGRIPQFDRVHAPRPLTPLSQQVLLPAFGDGMTAALHEIDYPHGFAMRAFNNFGYLGFVPSSKRGEELERLPRRAARQSGGTPGFVRRAPAAALRRRARPSRKPRCARQVTRNCRSAGVGFGRSGGGAGIFRRRPRAFSAIW